MVRARGLEPPRPCGHQHLKLAWLPITARALNREIVTFFSVLLKPSEDIRFLLVQEFAIITHSIANASKMRMITSWYE
jgi:hypothetical protein